MMQNYVTALKILTHFSFSMKLEMKFGFSAGLPEPSVNILGKGKLSLYEKFGLPITFSHLLSALDDKSKSYITHAKFWGAPRPKPVAFGHDFPRSIARLPRSFVWFLRSSGFCCRPVSAVAT
jgi:hypothetical protein